MPFAEPHVTYSTIGHLSAADLNDLAATKNSDGVSLFDQFDGLGYKLVFTPASRGVTLYRVCYQIDTNLEIGRQTISGLVAIPDADNSDGTGPRELPLVIYDHGTVFNTDAVPSEVVVPLSAGPGQQIWRVKSGETFLNLCRLVDQGYVLIASDYIGQGISSIKEGYGVKGITSEAIVGLLEASRSVLDVLGVQATRLFVNGWSQGGLNTQWAVQRLETLGIPVAAAAAESPFNDLPSTFRWWVTRSMQNPIEANTPAPWLALTTALLISSYEYWHGMDGLLAAMIKDTVIPDRSIATDKVIGNPSQVTYREVLANFCADYKSIDILSLSNLFWTVRILRNGIEQWTVIPAFTGSEMLVDGVLDQPKADVVNRFMLQLALDSPRDWLYKTPFKAWYGLSDEALPPELVSPGMADFGGSQVQLQPVSDASHRETFLNSLYATPLNPGGTDKNIADWFAPFLLAQHAVPQLLLSEGVLSVQCSDYSVLAVDFAVTQQSGDRPMYVQINRIRNDGSLEVVGAIAATSSFGGQIQSMGTDRILLQVGDRLSFQLLSRDGTSVDPSHNEIVADLDLGGYGVTIRPVSGSVDCSMKLNVSTEGLAKKSSDLDLIASPQGTTTDCLLQLKAKQKIGLQVSTDCAFSNRIGFIRLNLDPITGLPDGTVGTDNVFIGSPDFRVNIDSYLDSGFLYQKSGRFESTLLSWEIQLDGLYSPALITPMGDVFTFGAISDGNHLRRIGQNQFGFEDLLAAQSDWDWNDVVIRIVGIS